MTREGGRCASEDEGRPTVFSPKDKREDDVIPHILSFPKTRVFTYQIRTQILLVVFQPMSRRIELESHRAHGSRCSW